MRRKCQSCGKTFEAKTARRRFCSDTCRVRSSRQKTAPLVLVDPNNPPTPGAAAPESPPTTTGILAATRSQLEQAGAVDSALGQLALHLATRLQYVPETGAATAALSRELRAVIEAAKAVSTPTGDGLDEISKRIAQKRGASR